MSDVPYKLLSVEYRQALQQFVAADHELAIRLGVASAEEAREWILDALKSCRELFKSSISAWWDSGLDALRGLERDEPKVTSKGEPLARIGVDDPLPSKLELAWGTRFVIPLPPLTIAYHDLVVKALKGPDFITLDGKQRPVLSPDARWKLHIKWRAVGYINVREIVGGETYSSPSEEDEPFPVDVQVLLPPAQPDPASIARRIATGLTREGAEARSQYRLQAHKAGGPGLPKKLTEAVALRMNVSSTTARTLLEEARFKLPADLRLALKPPGSGR